MTVPRRNVPGCGAIWSRAKVLIFLQLLSGHPVWLQFVQIPA